MVKCRLCGTANSDVLFSKNDYQIVKCPECHFVFTDLQLPISFVKNYYKNDYFENGGQKHSYDSYESEEMSIRLTSQKRIKALSIDQMPPGNILDLGCAYGYFLD